MKAALILAAVILCGGCSATPTEVSNAEKSSQNEEPSAITSNNAQATATTSSLTKTSSKSSATARAGNSAQGENQGSGSFGEHELKDSTGHKSSGNAGQASGRFGGRGPIGFRDQELENDYLGKNFLYGGYDSEGEYEEQDDGFSNPEESGNYHDIDMNTQGNNNERGDIEGLSAALLLAHHANLARLLHLSHHLYVPEIIGLNFLTRGVPGGGLMNLWPLHHLTNHKLKELIALSNALSKSLPKLVKANSLGYGKALGLQSAGLQMSGMSSSGQDTRRFQGKRLNY